MERSIVESNFDVYEIESSYDTVFECFADTFFNRSDELFRNNTTDDSVNKLDAFTAGEWLDAEISVTILTTTT
jgi:hypothetical protein